MLSVNFCDTHFKNPILTASGTFGFGYEYEKYIDINNLGGLVTTGITYNPKEGNKGIRVYETPSGMMNSIGLENMGINNFIKKELSRLEELDTNFLVNLGGDSIDEYVAGAKILEKENVSFLELNISCPNVQSGGMAFGLDEELSFLLISKVREVYSGNLIVKLSPNGDTNKIGRIAEKAGADAISLVNTFSAMAIDIDNKKAVFDNKIAGLSGPCIKPISLRMVYELSKTVKIPIIGIGGITSYRDVLEYIMAGASLVQVGSSNFIKPDVTMLIINDLKEYMQKEKINSLDEIRGII